MSDTIKGFLTLIILGSIFFLLIFMGECIGQKKTLERICREQNDNFKSFDQCILKYEKP